MTNPIIKADGVDLTLQSRAGPVSILRGVSLDLAPGASVGIVGRSGSGKSSFLSLLAGLERPTAGRVRVNGEDLSQLNEDGLAAFRRKTIGVVFQAFHLIPTMTALENAALPLELSGTPNAPGRAQALLDKVGLGDRLQHFPDQLSGGEQQRVAIARALIAEPAVILADEPTGNLDQAVGSAISDLLFSMQRKSGAALVLVTHDPALAARCDRVVEMRDGRLELAENAQGTAPASISDSLECV